MGFQTFTTMGDPLAPGGGGGAERDPPPGHNMAEPSAPESKHKSSLNSSPWSGLMALGNSRHGPGAQCAHKAAGGAAPKPAPAGLSGGLSQPAGWQSLLSFTILFLAWLAGFSSRLFAVIRFESIIHEFDPW